MTPNHSQVNNHTMWGQYNKAQDAALSVLVNVK